MKSQQKLVEFLQFEKSYYHLFLELYENRENEKKVKEYMALLPFMEQKEKDFLNKISSYNEVVEYESVLENLYHININSCFEIQNITAPEIIIPAMRVQRLLEKIEAFVENQDQSEVLPHESVDILQNEYIYEQYQAADCIDFWLEQVQNNFLCLSNFSEKDFYIYRYITHHNIDKNSLLKKPSQIQKFSSFIKSDLFIDAVSYYIGRVFNKDKTNFSVEERATVLEAYLSALEEKDLLNLTTFLQDSYLDISANENMWIEKVEKIYEKYQVNLIEDLEVEQEPLDIIPPFFNLESLTEITSSLTEYFKNTHYLFQCYAILATRKTSFSFRTKMYEQISNLLENEKNILKKVKNLGSLQAYVRYFYRDYTFRITNFKKLLDEASICEQEKVFTILRLKNKLKKYVPDLYYAENDNLDEIEDYMEKIEIEYIDDCLWKYEKDIENAEQDIRSFLYFLQKEVQDQKYVVAGSYYLRFIFPDYEELNMITDYTISDELPERGFEKSSFLNQYQEEFTNWSLMTNNEIENSFFKAYVKTLQMSSNQAEKKEINKLLEEAYKKKKQNSITLQKKL